MLIFKKPFNKTAIKPKMVLGRDLCKKCRNPPHDF
jgi:hypothetical protein